MAAARSEPPMAAICPSRCSRLVSGKPL
jgi:hypothetical protein